MKEILFESSCKSRKALKKEVRYIILNDKRGVVYFKAT